ncbi:MAG: isochorismatase family protein [candidate division WOR-3 bacterium]
MKALLVIDVQEGLTKGKKLYNEKVFINTLNSAIDKFRKQGDTIIFFQHNNKQLAEGKKEWEIDSRIDKKRMILFCKKVILTRLRKPICRIFYKKTK